ncbi:hypothetical protein BASA81_005506 [Batrachochytrium salamandrivorans]|nr:hypothetical protein BASA81_005506 [Batrachochytrium salamandrivorans]
MLVFVLLALLALQQGGAIFADQAGLNDWVLQNIGEPIAFAAPAGADNKRFFLATQQGVLASFEANNKDFIWRRVLPESEPKPTSLVFDGQHVLLSVSNTTVAAWRAGDGILLWDFEVPNLSNIVQVRFVGHEHVAVLTAEHKVFGLNKLTGAGVSKLGLVGNSLAQQTDLVVVNGHLQLVELDEDGMIAITGGKERMQTVGGRGFALTSAGWLAYQASDHVVVLRDLSTATQIEFPFQAIKVYTQNDCLMAVNNEGQVFVLMAGDKTNAIRVDGGEFSFSASSRAVWSFADSTNAMRISQAGMQTYPLLLLGGGKRGWEINPQLVVVVGMDNSMSVFTVSSKLDLIWQREECLAEVDQIVSVRLPLYHSSQTGGGGGLGEIVSHVNSAVVTFVTNTVDMATLMVEGAGKFIQARGQGEGHFDKLKQTKLVVSDEHELSRFGFNRVLIFSTKVGKLVAVHSETKRTLWTYRLGAVGKMFIHSEELTVVNFGTGQGVVLNAINGQLLRKWGDNSNTSVTQAVSLSHSVLLLSVVGDQVKVSQHPVATQQQQGEVFVPVWSDHSFTGYVVDLKTLQAEVAWQLVFSTHERLLALAGPPENEIISSAVRSLGDGSLLVKYINPHLVTLMLSGEEGNTVKMLLVDTVSGRVLHRAVHREAQGPVHAVRFENWLVYSFWNTKALRTELVSMCLYDKLAVGKKQVNPWTTSPLPQNFSSFDPIELQILTKHFVLPGQHLTKLGVTTTLRGIASKNLLVSLGGTGQVLMLDQRLIDPRRPLGPPTEEEKTEGLFQYQAELPVVPQHVISYYQGTGELGANVFHVAPSQLESTCTVVASGLDVFKGRASPSGAFDLLAEDFDYVLLVAFLVFLAIGVVVLRSMDKSKALKAAWI